MSKKGPVAVTNWLICLFQLVLDLYAQEEQSLIAGLGSRIIFFKGLRLLIFPPSDSGSWYFFKRLQLQGAKPCGSLRLQFLTIGFTINKTYYFTYRTVTNVQFPYAFLFSRRRLRSLIVFVAPAIDFFWNGSSSGSKGPKTCGSGSPALLNCIPTEMPI